MSAPLVVSIVIPVLDGAETIADLLSGLLNQAHSALAYEIIVVDNGSTDSTCDIVRRFPVTLLSTIKRGPSVARNRGLYTARGEIVAYLDADTLPTRHWLTAIASPFSDERITLVAGRILPFKPSTAAQRFYARQYLDRGQENATAEGFPFASGANMAVRRKAALAVDGWDEDFLVSQDIDFSYRLQRTFPNSLYYEQDALVLIRSHRSLADLKKQAFKYGQGRARIWLNYPESAPKGVRHDLRLYSSLLVICTWPIVIRLGRFLGKATAGDMEFAECQRIWNWWHWRGYMSMRRHGEWR